MGTIANPTINGLRYSFASMEISLPGLPPITRFTKFSWDLEVDHGDVRGNQSTSLGFTQGELKVSGSFEMPVEEATNFVAGLGNGWMEQLFPITCTFGNTPFGTTTRAFTNCILKKDGEDGSKGSDGIVRKFEFMGTMMTQDGLSPLLPGQS